MFHIIQNDLETKSGEDGERRWQLFHFSREVITFTGLAKFPQCLNKLQIKLI